MSLIANTRVPDAILDTEVIKLAVLQEPAALAALHEKFKGLVLHQLNEMGKSGRYSRQFIEDTSQDVWLKVYKNIGRLEEPAKFQGWLHQIVKNTFINNIQSIHSKLDFIPLGTDGRTKDQDSGPLVFKELTVPSKRWTRSDLENIHSRIEEAFEALSKNHKTVFKLRYEDGLDTKQIAKLLKIPDGTVRSRLNAIRVHFSAHFPDRLELA